MFSFSVLNNSASVSTQFKTLTLHDEDACDGYYGCLTIDMHELKYLEMDSQHPVHVVFVACNIVGRTCTVTSPPIYLPSKHPPSAGIVMETLVNTSGEVDYVIRGQEVCVGFKGFTHHNDDVYIEVGIGDCLACNDTVVSFTDHLSTNQLCFDTGTFSEGYQYTSIVRASNSAGFTEVRSDGFRIIDWNITLESFYVNDGFGCGDIHAAEKMNITTEMNSTQFKSVLKIGHMYTLYNSGGFISFRSDDIYILRNISTPLLTHLEVIPIVHFPTFHFDQITKNVSISIKECQQNRAYTKNTGVVSANWDLRHNSEYVSHFIISLIDGNTSEVLALNTTNNHTHGSINFDYLTDGFYKMAIKPCFGVLCLKPVISNGTFITNRYDVTQHINLSAEILPGVTCTDQLHVSWTHHDTTLKDEVSLYRWTISTAVKATTVHSWNAVHHKSKVIIICRN